MANQPQPQPQPHVVAIPYPFQGHLMPVIKLSLYLVERGVKITMLVPGYIHARLIDSLTENEKGLYPFDFVTYPCEPQAAVHALSEKVTVEFQKLLEKMNGEIAGVIADILFGHTLEAARILGVPLRFSYCALSVGYKAFEAHIQEMIDMGVIDENGTPKTKDLIVWSPSMPCIEPMHLPWLKMGDYMSPKNALDSLLHNRQFRDSANWVLCNTFHALEHAAIAMVPNILTIGPLLENKRYGNLWPADSSCMSWLDKRAPNSVIYISFGSIASLSQIQFEELALGLELLGKPFLWVVRSANDVHGTSAVIFPDGFLDRVAPFSKIVTWVPQSKVLSHTSVACFVSQCGWNSTIEGLSNGVPLICWPSVYEQFFQIPYITDVWKVGLGMNPGKEGTISRVEIKRKLNQLLGDREIKQNSLKWKVLAIKSMERGGSTSKTSISWWSS